MRALCMVLVYLMHSEIYFLSTDVPSALIYTTSPFRVSTFFFISGFLFLGKYFTLEKVLTFSGARAMATNILRKLAWPTIAFSSLIYIPKKVFHHETADFLQYLYDVWGGMSYWFTSALCVSQLLLLATLLLCKQNEKWCLGFSLLYSITGALCNEMGCTHLPWQYPTAMMATPLLVIGGWYYKFQRETDRFVGRTPFIMAIAGCYAVLMLATYEGRTIVPWHYRLEWSFASATALVTGFIALLYLCKRLPAMKWCDYMGRHTIVYYFLSGVMPAFTSTIAHRLLPGMQHPAFCGCILVGSLLLSTIATHLIYRYFGFLLGCPEKKTTI